MSDLKNLQEQRGKIHNQMVALGEVAKKEERGLNTEEIQKFDKMDAEFRQITDQINVLERMAAIKSEQALNAFEQRQAETKGESRSDNAIAPGANAGTYSDVFKRYISAGTENMTREERSILKTGLGESLETRAQSVGTNSAGGYLVPTDLANELVMIMKQFGGMLEAGTIIPTTSGNPLNFPTLDDTSNVGELVAENAASNAQDAAVGQKTLNAYKYGSKLIKVSYELLQDSAFDFVQIVGRIGMERLGRIINQHLTTGTGSSQPNGLITATSAGKTSASNSAVTMAELIDLYHSVDPAYRNAASWMFNDSTLSLIKKLTIGSADDRALWQPSFVAGEPDRILGSPFIVNQDVASFGADAKPIAFGDLSKYYIRRVGQTRIRRSDDRHIENDQSVFVMFERIDGELMDTSAVKHLLNPS